jgi:hypothetical protein
MRKLVTSVIGLAVLGCSVAAHAADNGIYLGAGVGRSTVEIDNIDSSLDFKGDDTGYKIIAGIRPLDWLAIEANYVNFGEPDDSPGGVRLRTKGDGLGAYALGLFAVGPVDLFAKAGVVRWNAELKHPQFGRLDDDDGTDFAYGVGVQFRLLSLGVRGEYEVFDIDGMDKANMFSISVMYTFL